MADTWPCHYCNYVDAVLDASQVASMDELYVTYVTDACVETTMTMIIIRMMITRITLIASFRSSGFSNRKHHFMYDNMNSVEFK